MSIKSTFLSASLTKQPINFVSSCMQLAVSQIREMLSSSKAGLVSSEFTSCLPDVVILTADHRLNSKQSLLLASRGKYFHQNEFSMCDRINKKQVGIYPTFVFKKHISICLHLASKCAYTFLCVYQIYERNDWDISIM